MKTVYSKETDKFKLVAKTEVDKMKLFLDIEPKPGFIVRREDLLSVLAEFSLPDKANLGVLDDIVSKLNSGEKIVDRRILKGEPPEAGKDGKVVLLVKIFTGQATVRSEGDSSLSNLHLFDNLLVGQIVGRVYPPKPGKGGYDVLGNIINSKPGKPAALSLDKSLIVEDSKESDKSYQVIVSQSEGYLAQESGRLIVKDELVIKDNLDLHYGNIDFIGKVKIVGDVVQGFTVKARKGIELQGALRGGNLISSDGDIFVKGFVFGGKQSRIISGASFSAVVAQEANVECRGNILVEKEAIDCKLRTQTTLFMPKGRLIGGEIYAVCGVEANIIGNESGKKTVMRLCTGVETTVEYCNILVAIKSHDDAIKLLEMHLGPLAQNPDRIKLLNKPYRSKMEPLYAKLKQVRDSRISLLAKQKSALEGTKLNDDLRVNFHSKMYQSGEVLVEDKRFVANDDIKGPMSVEYNLVSKEFSVVPLKPIVCNVTAS